MPSSIDVARLSALNDAIDESNRGANALTGGMTQFGNTAASSITKALQNRKDLAGLEGQKAAKLDKDINEYMKMKTAYGVAGLDTSEIDARLDELRAEKSKMGTVDISKPTPSWGMDKMKGQNPMGPINS